MFKIKYKVREKSQDPPDIWKPGDKLLCIGGVDILDKENIEKYKDFFTYPCILKCVEETVNYQEKDKGIDYLVYFEETFDQAFAANSFVKLI